MHGGSTLISTGSAGAIIAAICCATPLLAIVLGALGLGAWIATADYLVIATLLISLALVGVGLYRRRVTAQSCCDRPASDKAESHE